jgi:hypothetical protein
MCHPFFDELRQPDAKMANGKPMPELFDFSREELSVRPDLNAKLVPPHAEAALLERGIDVNNFQPLSAESCVPLLRLEGKLTSGGTGCASRSNETAAFLSMSILATRSVSVIVLLSSLACHPAALSSLPVVVQHGQLDREDNAMQPFAVFGAAPCIQ